MHVTRDLSPEVCVIRELFVLGRENLVFLRFFGGFSPGGVLPQILDRGVPRRFLNPNPI